MNKKPMRKRDVAAAQRGLIVQRVLVDGRTPEEAGAPFGVDGQVVARWVAAYRRHGMAVLRGENAAEGRLRRWTACFLAWIGATPSGIGRKRLPAMRPTDGGDAATRRWN
jgi:hypothetical protein